MDPKNEPEIAVDFSPIARIYKDGRVERLIGEEIVPASSEPQNGVVSKDVVYSPEKNLSVRLFIPQKTLESGSPSEKLPLLVYFHGGAFIIGSPFAPTYHNYLTEVVAAAGCIAVSVQYRRAPENQIPIPYEDSWEGLKWVWSHSKGTGPEDWINRHADFNRTFLGGDSAGGNIAHHMGMKSGGDPEIRILGIFLANPYFWSKDPIDEHDIQDKPTRVRYGLAWNLVSPASVDGNDDPLINVVNGPSIAGIGCRRMLVMVADKDFLARQGIGYARKLKESGWGGEMEILEIKNEEHVFHLLKPECENAKIALEKFVELIKKE